MPGTKCGGCGRYIKTLEGAKCGKCQLLYHRECVRVATKAVVPASWRCPECKRNQVRDNGAETPVRGSAVSPLLAESPGLACVEASPPNTAIDSCRRAPEICEEQPGNPSSAPTPSPYYASVAAADIRPLLDELRAMRGELQEFRREMEVEMVQLKNSMHHCNTRIDSLEARISALEQQPSSGHSSVDGVVEELRRELNDRDQDLLGNDIEVSNIPEASSDNPIHIIQLIGLKLGVKVEERDIVSAERVGIGRAHV